MTISESERTKIRQLGNRELVDMFTQYTLFLDDYSSHRGEIANERFVRTCEYTDELKYELLRRLEAYTEKNESASHLGEPKCEKKK